MGKRRKKRGRPRTGHDAMVGIRLPAAALRKIDKLTEALSLPDRSATLRFLISGGIDQNSWLLRSGKGRGVTGRIVVAKAAEVKATAAERAAEHGGVEAEIKALRARGRAEALASAEADRIALAGAARPASLEQKPRDVEIKAAVVPNHSPARQGHLKFVSKQPCVVLCTSHSASS